MEKNKNQLITRYKRFTIDVVRFCNTLPKETAFFVFAKQVIRCSSSMGANYRAACRAKSTADFINKLKIVEEESDESVYFLELIEELLTTDKTECQRLVKEGDELLRIVVASLKTARFNNSQNN